MTETCCKCREEIMEGDRYIVDPYEVEDDFTVVCDKCANVKRFSNGHIRSWEFNGIKWRVLSNLILEDPVEKGVATIDVFVSVMDRGYEFAKVIVDGKVIYTTEGFTRVPQYSYAREEAKKWCEENEIKFRFFGDW